MIQKCVASRFQRKILEGNLCCFKQLACAAILVVLGVQGGGHYGHLDGGHIGGYEGGYGAEGGYGGHYDGGYGGHEEGGYGGNELGHGHHEEFVDYHVS